MEPCGPPPPYSYEPLATQGSFHGNPAYSPPEHLPLPSIMSVGFDGLSVSPSHRFPLNRDDLDGPVQFLNKPDGAEFEPQDEDIPNLPTNLLAPDQYFLLSQMNDRLSRSVFDFIAKYQFPIPIEATKRPVCVPSDRHWSEWVGLLKGLVTKRRIPARLIYNRQLPQVIPTLENSLEIKHVSKRRSRPLKDDRNILQLISAGIQVAKALEDAPAMHDLDMLYVHTTRLIRQRERERGFYSRGPRLFHSV